MEDTDIWGNIISQWIVYESVSLFQRRIYNDVDHLFTSSVHVSYWMGLGDGGRGRKCFLNAVWR